MLWNVTWHLFYHLSLCYLIPDISSVRLKIWHRVIKANVKNAKLWLWRKICAKTNQLIQIKSAHCGYRDSEYPTQKFPILNLFRDILVAKKLPWFVFRNRKTKRTFISQFPNFHLIFDFSKDKTKSTLYPSENLQRRWEKLFNGQKGFHRWKSWIFSS